MSDRRQLPRYIAEFDAAVAQPPGAPPQSVTLVNLSMSGCSVEGGGSLMAGQHCEITFEREGQQFRAEATVTWKSSQGEVGMKFIYASPTDLELLRKICATLRLQPLVHREEE
jgi:hypothetical protein